VDDVRSYIGLVKSSVRPTAHRRRTCDTACSAAA